MPEGTVRHAAPVSNVWLTTRVLSAADYATMVAPKGTPASSNAGNVGRLQSLHEEARHHGYQQGLQRALADLADVLTELRRCRGDREAWLQSFVFAVLRKILGEQDPLSLVGAIARQAIAQCEQSLGQLTVHVHPRAVNDVTEAIETQVASTALTEIRVDVVADDRLSETGCEVHTPFGIIEASLETQLDALEHAVAAHGKG